MARGASAVPTKRYVLLVLLAACGVYFLLRAPLGWIGYDDGMMAQAAERTLSGELPHRDFNEPYTGALTFLHAAGMKLLGVKLVSMRYVLLACALAFVAGVYRLASEVTQPLGAAFVTLLCVAWSVPNYFAPMPSWYNLFLATAGLLCWFRYVDSERVRFLALAGALAGMSCLVKVIGAYSLAAGLLVIGLRVPLLVRATGNARVAPLLAGGALLVFVTAVLTLLLARWSAMALLLFGTPALVLAAVVALHPRLHPELDASPNLRRALREAAVFLAGAALPIALYAGVFAALGGLDALYEGVVAVPRGLLGVHGGELPELASGLWAAPWATVFLLGLSARTGGRRLDLVLAVLALAMLALLPLAAASAIYDRIWASVRPLAPTVIVAGALALCRADAGLSAQRRQKLFALLATAGLFSLVQFPYSGGIYFCYAAPLLILAGTFAIHAQPRPLRYTHAAIALFYGLFAFVYLHRQDTYMLGLHHVAIANDTPLDGGRAGILVPRAQAQRYRELIEEVHAHSRPGEFMYAAPDVPELYFLAARRNPTRTLFEWADRDYARPEARDHRILRDLDARDVRVVVLGPHVEFSEPPSPLLTAGLVARYPRSTRLGPYLVLWR